MASFFSSRWVVACLAAPAATCVMAAEDAAAGATVLDSAILMVALTVLVVACGWLIRRLASQRQSTGTLPIRVVSVCSLGQRERVVLVEINGTWLVLGVTPSHVSALHTCPAHPQPGGSGGSPGASKGLSGVLSARLSQSLQDALTRR